MSNPSLWNRTSISGMGVRGFRTEGLRAVRWHSGQETVVLYVLFHSRPIKPFQYPVPSPIHPQMSPQEVGHLQHLAHVCPGKDQLFRLLSPPLYYPLQ